MKSGVDGVRPNMNLATAVDMMMIKTERKDENTAKKRANQMNAIRLLSILDEGKKLVHWCGIEAHKEWIFTESSICSITR